MEYYLLRSNTSGSVYDIVRHIRNEGNIYILESIGWTRFGGFITLFPQKDFHIKRLNVDEAAVLLVEIYKIFNMLFEWGLEK